MSTEPVRVVLRAEPVRVVSILISVVLLCLPHLPAFGITISEDQTRALNEVLPSLLVIIGGEVVRSRVRPVQP
jgi:uncharacterized membrane protein